MKPEKKEEKKGTLNYKRLAQALVVIPGYPIFFYFIYHCFRSNTAGTVVTLFLLAILAAIIYLIYYAIIGTKIMVCDVIVTETKARWDWLHTADEDENGQKKKK